MVEVTSEWQQCVHLQHPQASAALDDRVQVQLSIFAQQAEELLAGLDAMHRFLRSQYEDYVDNHRGLASHASTMADKERDVIDQQVAAFAGACGVGIESLKALLQRRQLAADEEEAARSGASAIRSDSREAHEHAAITCLFERLKAVTALAQTMQSERRTLMSLASGRFTVAAGSGGAALSQDAIRSAVRASPEEEEEDAMLREACPAAFSSDLDPSTAPPSAPQMLQPTTGVISVPQAREQRRQPPQQPPPPAGADSKSRRLSSSAFSEVERRGKSRDAPSAAAAEQRLRLEDENRELAAALRSELDDVRQVEGRVTEISALLSLFATKVVEQHDEVAHIYDAAVATNETVRRGGQHLDKAAERTGSFRKFYVVFMLSMSFALLFLHLFNP